MSAPSLYDEASVRTGIDPAAAHAIASRAENADGVPAISEQFLLGLDDPHFGHTHFGVYLGDQLAGFAAVDGDSVELVVDPAHRRHGLGSKLIDAATAHGVTKIWAHGDLPGAQHIGAAHHMVVTRTLLVMGSDDIDVSVVVPEGFTIMNLTQARAELDDADGQWLKANNQAFSWHPEQGGWDLDRLARAQKTTWFRPEDVLFLVHDGDIAGFHWLKRHSETLGEIYVVGLARDFRGKGLGDPLVRAGLKHLHDLGMNRAILYVEADNKPAVNAYTALGFQVHERHVVYEPQGEL